MMLGRRHDMKAVSNAEIEDDQETRKVVMDLGERLDQMAKTLSERSHELMEAAREQRQSRP